MTENKKELLELAAKAAGVGGNYLFRAGGSKGSGFPYHIEGIQKTGGAMWNPITDDGTCARMEAAIGIDVEWYQDKVRSYKHGECLVIRYEFFSNHNGDKNAARRMASVRCAAEIGKNIGEQS